MNKVITPMLFCLTLRKVCINTLIDAIGFFLNFELCMKKPLYL